MEKALKPQNNKALFSTLSKAMADLLNDELPIEKAREISTLSARMQKCLTHELERVKILHEIGNTEAKFRDIEKQFDESAPSVKERQSLAEL